MCDEVLFREARPPAHAAVIFLFSQFETNHGSSFQPTTSSYLLCHLFVMPPLAVSSDFISRHGFSMCRKVGNKSLRISWPLAKNPWIDGCRVAAKRTTSCNKWNLNQPKCGQMKKWHGAWQETCILGICNSRTVVYWQRRHFAQNVNTICCKKVDIA